MPSPLSELLSTGELRDVGMDQLKRKMLMQLLLQNPVAEGNVDRTSPYYSERGGVANGILPDRSNDRGMAYKPMGVQEGMALRDQALLSPIADYQNRGRPDLGGTEMDKAAGMGAVGARGGSTPVRGLKSLNKAIQEAEGDEDLLRIKKLLDARGIDTSAIPAFQGL